MEKKINTAELAAIIRGLTIDDEKKSQLLELLNDKKRFGLIWEQHPEYSDEAFLRNIPVLREETGRFVDSNSTEAGNHIIIEGDNYQALHDLCFTHENSIDVIYIDPPYNTGNNDFIYNDSFVGEDDSYRHSKWLSFMDKRLKLAKRLLSDKGVIFISIDDNEQAHLKLLCDEVFGENNFIANLVWQKKFSRSNDALYFSTMHDHILCYVKNNIKQNQNGWRIGLLGRASDTPKGYSNPDNDPRGPWTSTIMSAKSGGASLLYEITTPSGRIVSPPSGRFWSCSKDTFEEWKNDGRIWFGKDGNGSPRKKTFLSEVQEGLRPNTIILLEEGGNNQEGKQELKAIFGGEGVFDGPKPTKLIRHLLTIANCKNGKVLDFFAGSGTTMHAVMQLNAEDGGHRQCILVTNNENNICEEVTYERNKRVIEGYTTPKGEFVEGLHNNKLRYFKTELKDRTLTHQNKKELVYSLTDVLRIKEDCYTEQKAFGGLNLTGKEKLVRYFEENGKRMLIIYDSRVIEYIVNEIKKMDVPDDSIKIYIFADGACPYTEDFKDVIRKVSLIPMPFSVFHALKNVLPEEKDVVLEREEDNTSTYNENN